MYENRAILFLDILGYRNIIKDTQRAEAMLQVLQRMQSYSAQLGTGHLDLQSSTFSDCIVISATAQSGDAVCHIASIASFVSLDLISKGFLTRGALTIGELYHNEGIVMGPALVEAYELETTLAIYPRILLVPDAVQALGSGLGHLLNSFQSGNSKITRVDFDGVHYLNIFTNAFLLPPEYRPCSGEEKDDAFHKACTGFVSSILAAEFPASAQPKYDWFANFFASICSEYGWVNSKA